MAALRSRVPARMTVDEFISWDSGDRSGRRWQLVDGEPVPMVLGSLDHGALQGEVCGLIGNHLRATGSECRMIVSPGIVSRLSFQS
jgi:Uma2 family endonuclease